VDARGGRGSVGQADVVNANAPMHFES